MYSKQKCSLGEMARKFQIHELKCIQFIEKKIQDIDFLVAFNFSQREFVLRLNFRYKVFFANPSKTEKKKRD